MVNPTKSQVLLAYCEGSFTCQGQMLPSCTSYRYLGL